MQDRACILLVEDEQLVADGLRYVIDELDLGVCQVARTADEALSAALVHKPLLIIMDLQLMGRKDGVDAAREIHQHLNCPIIFTTGDIAPTAIQRIFQDKPSAVLKKPFSPDELKKTIQRALRERLHDEQT